LIYDLAEIKMDGLKFVIPNDGFNRFDFKIAKPKILTAGAGSKVANLNSKIVRQFVRLRAPLHFRI